MRNKNRLSGFHVSEVVIILTLIAILWLIGFIAYRWYALDARNTSRVTILTSLQKLVSVKMSSGEDLLQYVVPGQEVPWAHFWWKPAGSDYKAGEIDFRAIGIADIDQFEDPKREEYPRLGVLWTAWKEQYEFAMSLEAADGSAYTTILWNYDPDTSFSSAEPLWLINAAWEIEAKPVYEWSSDVVYDF